MRFAYTIVMKRVEKLLSNFATPEILVNRSLEVAGRKSVLIYNPDLTDGELLSELVKSLFKVKRIKGLADLLSVSVAVTESKIESDEAKSQEAVLCGDAVLFVEKEDNFLVCTVRKWDKRAIAEPPTGSVTKGPREGFIEDVKTNLSLLARRLKSPHFAVEKLQIGRFSKTTVAVAYLSNVAPKRIVRKIKHRLKKIDTDGIIDSYYLQPYLEDKPYSVFHQTGVTEKPDIVTAKLLEGRVAIIVDGSPMVLTLPFMLVEDYQSGIDYYERPVLASFLRLLRVTALFFAIFLPGLYVALQQYHYNTIPLRFLITVMTAVNGIPFSPLSEILFVIILFELIKEAGVRMPRAVGMAMSIVGALVLGDTAVKAGIISSPAVMITALSSIALFTAPNQEGTFTILRIVFTLLGGLGGMYFLLCGALYLVHYLCSMNGYGVPYTAPFAPLVLSDLKDSVYRVNLRDMTDRPKSLRSRNKIRRGKEE